MTFTYDAVGNLTGCWVAPESFDYTWPARIWMPQGKGGAMAEPSHSRAGLVSFWLGPLSIVAGPILLLAVAVGMSTSLLLWVSPNERTLTVLGVIACAAAAMALVGLVLGVIGFKREGRKGLFPMLGTGMSGLVLVCYVYVFVQIFDNASSVQWRLHNADVA